MTLKSCFIPVLLFCTGILHAQDKIYKKDGSVINAKVQTVGETTISYKRADNATGPDYTLQKSELQKIIYENGTTDVFDAVVKGRAERLNRKKEKAKFGNNMLSVIPGCYSMEPDGSMSDPGVGVSYERYLDKQQHVSFVIPVILNFISKQDLQYDYNTGYNSSAGVYEGKKYTSFYTAPGIRFYPSRRNQAVRYALGFSVFTILGTEPEYVYNQAAPSVDDYHYAIYGAMITNSMNVTLNKHMYIALEMNGGIPLADNRYVERAEIETVLIPMMQFMFKLGYRF